MIPPQELRAFVLSLQSFNGGGITLHPLSTAGLMQIYTTSSFLEVGLLCLDQVVKNPLFIAEHVAMLEPEQLNIIAEWGELMLKGLAAFEPLDGFQTPPVALTRWDKPAFEWLALESNFKYDYDFRIWQSQH